jgi:O-antigen/teichoic acid export membrane protein
MGIIQKQGIQNTIISYTGIIIGFINVLILQPIMLSPEELGLVRILYSTATLLGTIFPLGLNGVTIKFLPSFRDPQTGNKGMLGFILLLSTVFCILMFGCLFLFKDMIIQKYVANAALFVEYIYYVLPLTICIGYISLINVYFFAQFKSSFPSFMNEVYVRLLMVLIVSLYYLKLISFEWMMRWYLLIFVSQLMVLLSMVFKHEIKALKIDWHVFNKQKVKELLMFSLTMALATIASIALRNVDVLIIGMYLPLSQVAVYTISVTIAGIIEAPAAALAKIADSKISHAFATNHHEEIKEIYTKSTRILMLTGFVLFTIIAVNLSDLLKFLPNKYAEGETVILIVSLSALFNMMTGINSSIIFYSNKHKQGTLLLVVLILSSIVLNLLLIPKYGIIGAGIATSLNLLFFNLLKFMMIYYYFKLQPFGSYVWKIMASCLLAYMSCNLIEWGQLINIFFKSLLVMLIFGAAIIKFDLLPEMHPFLRKLRLIK